MDIPYIKKLLDWRKKKKSEDIIKELKNKNFIDYTKNATNVYSITKNNLAVAKQNAKKLRSEVEKYDSDKKIYERNPYTNLDLLVEEIQHPDLKENTEAFWDEFYK